jgi:hypothetical protein
MPFRFLDSADALGQLRKSLAQVGLTLAEPLGDDERAADPYHLACLRVTCSWLEDVIELRWHYAWWPDGMNSELARIEVVYQGTVRGEIDVARLLGERLSRPLSEVVTEQIAVCCATLTGKPVRIPRRTSESDAETGS